MPTTTMPMTMRSGWRDGPRSELRQTSAVAAGVDVGMDPLDLTVIVAYLEGCPFAALDDAEGIERILHQAVQAGGSTLLHAYVHRFEPQGVTGAAVLAESHIALHTWPEHGRLFVDMATCAGSGACRQAFARIVDAIPHQRIRYVVPPA